MSGSKLCPSLGVRTAQVFTVSTVLGSAEGERWQVGPRLSPLTISLPFDFGSRAKPQVGRTDCTALFAGIRNGPRKTNQLT